MLPNHLFYRRHELPQDDQDEQDDQDADAAPKSALNVAVASPPLNVNNIAPPLFDDIPALGDGSDDDKEENIKLEDLQAQLEEIQKSAAANRPGVKEAAETIKKTVEIFNWSRPPILTADFDITKSTFILPLETQKVVHGAESSEKVPPSIINNLPNGINETTVVSETMTGPSTSHSVENMDVEVEGNTSSQLEADSSNSQSGAPQPTSNHVFCEVSHDLQEAGKMQQGSVQQGSPIHALFCKTHSEQLVARIQAFQESRRIVRSKPKRKRKSRVTASAPDLELSTDQPADSIISGKSEQHSSSTADQGQIQSVPIEKSNDVEMATTSVASVPYPVITETPSSVLNPLPTISEVSIASVAHPQTEGDVYNTQETLPDIRLRNDIFEADGYSSDSTSITVNSNDDRGPDLTNDLASEMQAVIASSIVSLNQTSKVTSKNFKVQLEAALNSVKKLYEGLDELSLKSMMSNPQPEPRGTLAYAEVGEYFKLLIETFELVHNIQPSFKVPLQLVQQRITRIVQYYLKDKSKEGFFLNYGKKLSTEKFCLMASDYVKQFNFDTALSTAMFDHKTVGVEGFRKQIRALSAKGRMQYCDSRTLITTTQSQGTDLIEKRTSGTPLVSTGPTSSAAVRAHQNQPVRLEHYQVNRPTETIRSGTQVSIAQRQPTMRYNNPGVPLSSIPESHRLPGQMQPQRSVIIPVINCKTKGAPEKPYICGRPALISFSNGTTATIQTPATYQTRPMDLPYTYTPSVGRGNPVYQSQQQQQAWRGQPAHPVNLLRTSTHVQLQRTGTQQPTYITPQQQTTTESFCLPMINGGSVPHSSLQRGGSVNNQSLRGGRGGGRGRGRGRGRGPNKPKK